MTFKIPKGFDHRVWLRFPVQALVDVKLTRQQLRTLAAICMHLDERYQTFVGHAAVGRIIGISRVSAGRHYRKLLEQGHIRRTSKKGRGYVTEVRFTNPKAEALFKLSGLDEVAITGPHQKQVKPFRRTSELNDKV